MDSIGSRHAPHTAVVRSVLRDELDRYPGRVLRVLDVGGGTGGFAVPLAELGHRVTVIDASPDALASLRRRAAEQGVADRIEAVQADADEIGKVAEPESVDLALCHAVLEVVDDVDAVAGALATALRPGGVASVLVAGRAGAVLSRALSGQLADAARLVAAGRPRRFDAAGARAVLERAGLRVEAIHGVRVFADLVGAAVAEEDPAALLELELAVAAEPPYRDIASQLHLLARRPA
ncbi:methyltransferase [Pilimelia anulata]|uniref:Methyltransferase n=1 Tax=Pilimelia anulata TaxID=53371 RepID=A0A8J3B1I1_9ACTN|nr:methyltransferase domain-containing protein [Pilimelia anulata]GGJ85409.1 methyltransferase [Pilimelia anulata]